MPVVLEKDRIIITIKSVYPENELADIRNDIIYAIQHFDTSTDSHNFYHIMDLLREMIPGKHTYKYLKASSPFDINPLRKTIFDFSPKAHIEYLGIAIEKLSALKKKEEAKSVDAITIADTIGHIEAILKAIKEGVKSE